MVVKLKLKPCRICKNKFMPVRAIQPTCSYDCSVAYAMASVEKKKRLETLKTRRETKQKLDKLKPLREWESEAQQWVNKYVRLRDRDLGCITCDKAAGWQGQWHASHYRTTKAASAVRFNLWNIHKSCSVCNNFLSGNLGEYEYRIREKIGNEKVDWIRSQNQTIRYTVDYLKRLKGIFKKKCARLEKRL